MNKLSRNEWVAIGAGLALLAYLFFAEPLVNLFSPNMNENTDNTQMTTGFTSNETEVGQGIIAEPGDTVTAHYRGTLANGQVFDSSYDRGEPITFTLGVGQVIRGWDEGLQGMREGGKRTLVISPEYGYGARAIGSIPANSTLYFEVELVKVEKATQ